MKLKADPRSSCAAARPHRTGGLARRRLETESLLALLEEEFVDAVLKLLAAYALQGVYIVHAHGGRCWHAAVLRRVITKRYFLYQTRNFSMV